MTPNYTPYHIHTFYSNPTTNIDSVASPESYIEKAVQCGMKAIAFSEHGNVYNWVSKKLAVEKAGLKYIHAAEVYVTEKIDFGEDGKPVPVRDNYHAVLIARNYQGVMEINRLVSAGRSKDDGHFYYQPRITFDELCATSDNIIVTTACIGGIVAKAQPPFKDKVIDFLRTNKHRCFLEVQPHFDMEQLALNRELEQLSKRYDIPLIAGTDTHATDDFSAECRSVLQRAKGAFFEGEENFDLRFKSYDELTLAFHKQGVLNEETYLKAIANTNVMADMVEPFELDRVAKYPALADDPDAAFWRKIEECIAEHPVAAQRYDRDTIMQRVQMEFDAFKQTGSVMYMLLMRMLIEWCKEHEVYIGPGRGSVSGSFVAWLMGITDIDPIRFNLSFSRFCNKDRISLADIDTDWADADRDAVMEFVLRDKLGLDNIQSCQIVTFQTLKMRGAIKDIGRALNLEPFETDAIAKQELDEDVPPEVRAQYPELFRLVDGVLGTVTTVGKHAAGVVIADTSHDLAGEIGLAPGKDSEYPSSAISMDDISYLQFVKMDFLGLKTVDVINRACKLAGLSHLTPDNIDVEDEAVWKSIRSDTTGIFQYEKSYAQAYLAKLISDDAVENSRDLDDSFSYLQRFALGNGLLRPGAASFRDAAGEGIYRTYPIPEMNDLLAASEGYLVFQEDIMAWLVRFCGYSDSESDTVRRAIAHKGSAETFEKLTGEIRRRFIDYTPAHYNVPTATAEDLIDPFIQTIIDASSYAFSWNHSIPYSFIGYVCGYLRYYHPREFIAAAVDVFAGDTEKVAAYMAYAKKLHIDIAPARFGKSRSYTMVDKATGKIYQNIAPVKNVSTQSAEELYDISTRVSGEYFIDVLEAAQGTCVKANMLESLIKIDFFADMGNMNELTKIAELHDDFKKRASIKADEADKLGLVGIEQYANTLTKAGKPAKQFTITDRVAFMHALEDSIKAQHLPDFCTKAKIGYQMELMGRVDIQSGKEEDRYKLYLTQVKPMKSKKTGRVWGYLIEAMSMGTGGTQTLTVYPELYAHLPVNKGDIIRSNKESFVKNKKGYWVIMDYKYDNE